MKWGIGMRHIRIYLMGGTIAAKIGEDGTSSTVDLKEYVEQFCESGSVVKIDVRSFCSLGGFETRYRDVIELSSELNRAVREDHLDGVVIIMGTNVMEEMAFALQLLTPAQIPIAVTGAMRISTAVSADGPANILSAVAVASDPACRGLGTVVVFNEDIHSADYVQKLHPSNLNAFQSDYRLGAVVEGKVSLRTRPIKRPVPWINIVDLHKDVLLYETYFSDSGRILDGLKAIKYDGIVVDGTGCGSVPYWILEKLDELHKEIPIVLASRTGHGDVLTATYGKGYGCPQYYVEQNYLIAGILDARKAAVLLTLLLMSHCSEEEIRESFRRYSRDYAGEEDYGR